MIEFLKKLFPRKKKVGLSDYKLDNRPAAEVAGDILKDAYKDASPEFRAEMQENAERSIEDSELNVFTLPDGSVKVITVGPKTHKRIQEIRDSLHR